MSSCATDRCRLHPDLCDTCKWLAFKILGCDVMLEEGRCRFIEGHEPPCQPVHTGKREKAAA